jgi:flagellar protein FliO/FliZ
MTGLAEPASPLSAGSLLQLTLSLAAIVGLILALGWLLKRFRLATPRSGGDMAVLDEIVLGPRERIALVRVGEAQVLVGIGSGGIVPLTPLATPIAINTSVRAPAFADRMRDLMKRPGA